MLKSLKLWLVHENTTIQSSELISSFPSSIISDTLGWKQYALKDYYPLTYLDVNNIFSSTHQIKYENVKLDISY